MRNITSLLITLALIISIIGLVGCKHGVKTDQAQVPETDQTQVPETHPTSTTP